MARSIHLLRVGCHEALSGSRRMPSSCAPSSSRPGCAYTVKFSSSRTQSHGGNLRRSLVQTAVMDDDFARVSSLNDWDDGVGISGRNFSDGEDSDTESLIIPSTEIDLPHINSHLDRSDAVTAAVYQFASLGRRQKRAGIQPGVFINLGLFVFSVMLLLFLDCSLWKIVRLPLPSFFLIRPFLISAFLALCIGILCVPLLDNSNVHQVILEEGPFMHTSKRKVLLTAMGGFFSISVGVGVAIALTGLSSVEVCGASAATLAYGAIGLLNIFFIRNHNHGLSLQTKFFLQAVAGTCFSFWLGITDISSPYNMKTLVPLPSLGLMYLGKKYSFLTVFSFTAMGNGVNLLDDLDGLAGGTAALAFIGMSVAVLPICSDLSIFGSSMAGACVGLLLHNCCKACILMGDIGSMALGGALAAMAACTGMFFPLFIAAGVFILEMSSLIMQVSFFMAKSMFGSGCRLLRMIPFHQHFKKCGLDEPLIVVNTYVTSAVLAILAGYVGLISA